MKVALGIGSCALGSYSLVVTQANHCCEVCMPKSAQCPIANDQLPKQPFSNQVIYIVSVLSTVSCLAPYRGIQIPESKTLLFVESGILGFEIRNTAQGFRNRTNDWIPDHFKFH